MDGNHFRKALRQVRPFTGRGQWLDKPDLPATYNQRLDEVRSYARGHGWTLSDEHIGVLAHCTKSSQLIFVHELLQLSGWVVSGEQTLMNTKYMVRVSLGALIDDVSVPILIDDIRRDKRFALMIEGPKHLPGMAAAMRRRHAEVRQVVHVVWVCSDLEARAKGLSFRKDLERVALDILLRHESAMGSKTLSPRPAEHSDLTLELSGLPSAERESKLASWLAGKELDVSADALRLLAKLEHVDEVLFAVRLIRLPGVSTTSSYFMIGELYRLYPGATVQGKRVGAVLSPQPGGGAAQPKTIFQFSRGIRPRSATRHQVSHDDRLREVGFEVIRVPAGQAKDMGSVWQRRIYDELMAARRKKARSEDE